MPSYNVLVPVVAVLDADTSEAAIQRLRLALSEAGFEPYEEMNDAFESEVAEEPGALPVPRSAPRCYWCKKGLGELHDGCAKHGTPVSFG